MSRAATALALGALGIYQRVLSGMLGPACRFEPSCSRFAAEAIERMGLARGAWLALRRLGRCHPFGGSGYDPVPNCVSPRGMSDGS
ncbi:MAG TPA: membrane protein insertion efficiency factor YidD [Myxococcota bacterium]|nr:membrane protein insertion efficiency factor YidD [Myxococcota bacterium]